MTVVLLIPVHEINAVQYRSEPIKCSSFFEARNIALKMGWSSYEITVEPTLIDRKVVRSPGIDNFQEYFKDNV